MNRATQRAAWRAPILSTALGVALGAAGALGVVATLQGPRGALAAEAESLSIRAPSTSLPPRPDPSALAPVSVADPLASPMRAASRQALEDDDALGLAIARWRKEGWIDDAELARAAFAELIAKRRPAEAAECGAQFLAGFASDRSAGAALATAFAERGEFEIARAWLARALDGGGDAALLIRYAEWDAEGAQEQARVLLARIDPLDTDRRAAFARVFSACGLPAEGAELLRQRLAAQPDDARALAQLWGADADAAEQHLRRLGRDPATDREFRDRLFQARLARDDLAGAEELLVQAHAHGTSDAAAFAVLAEHRLAAGAQDDACRLWARAIDCETEDPTAWIEPLAELDADGLRRCLESRVAREGATTAGDEIWGALGDARWRAGEGSAARAAWSTAAALDPADREWTSKLDAVRDGLDPLAQAQRD